MITFERVHSSTSAQEIPGFKQYCIYHDVAGHVGYVSKHPQDRAWYGRNAIATFGGRGEILIKSAPTRKAAAARLIAEMKL